MDKQNRMSLAVDRLMHFYRLTNDTKCYVRAFKLAYNYDLVFPRTLSEV